MTLDGRRKCPAREALQSAYSTIFRIRKADTGKQHQSYQETLKHVHLPPALDQSGFDHDIAVGIQSSLTQFQEYERLH
jgi:hypothetical protein